MLTRLEVRNFQSHENTVIDLGPITTLIGPSDVGKSALVRALRWLATNRPGGTAYIRWGESRCRVRAWVDGRVIGRDRADDRNQYTIDGKVYAAVGMGVPDDVAALLNTSPDCFQGQLDLHYWFSDSGGDVGRYLNDLVNLGTIDKVAAALAGQARAAEAAVVAAQTAVTISSDAVIELDWVDDAVAAWEVVVRLAKAWEAAAAKSASLNSDFSNVQQAKATAQRATQRKLALEKVAKAAQVAGKAGQQVAALAKLVATAQGYKARPRPDFTPVAAAAAKLNEAVSKRMAFEKELRGVEQKRVHARDRGISAGAAGISLNAYIKKEGGVCPICNQPMKKSSES